MPIMTEEAQGMRLVTSREPVGPAVKGAPGSAGEMAVRDALIIIGIAWLILFFLTFSLRAHNV